MSRTKLGVSTEHTSPLTIDRFCFWHLRNIFSSAGGADLLRVRDARKGKSGTKMLLLKFLFFLCETRVEP